MYIQQLHVPFFYLPASEEVTVTGKAIAWVHQTGCHKGSCSEVSIWQN